VSRQIYLPSVSGDQTLVFLTRRIHRTGHLLSGIHICTSEVKIMMVEAKL